MGAIQCRQRLGGMLNYYYRRSLRLRSNFDGIVTINEARGTCSVSLILGDRRQVTTLDSREIVFLERASLKFLDHTRSSPSVRGVVVDCVSCSERKPCSQALTPDDRRHHH